MILWTSTETAAKSIGWCTVRCEFEMIAGTATVRLWARSRIVKDGTPCLYVTTSVFEGKFVKKLPSDKMEIADGARSRIVSSRVNS